MPGPGFGCLLTSACSSNGECVRAGKDLLENRGLVADLATSMGLPTQNHEAEFIVGAAWAVAQLEGGQQGIPVSICLLPGKANDIEFRTLSTDGKVFDEWRSVSAMKALPSRGLRQD